MARLARGCAVPRLPTIRDVARAAGVHHSTVSRALRNDPRIPEETRQRVRLAVAQTGYRPNPLVSTLMARRQAARAARHVANLALVFPSRAYFERIVHCRIDQQAVVDRAEALGYSVDTVFADEYSAPERPLDRVLRSRGMIGVIFDTVEAHQLGAGFDPAAFACVSVGASVLGLSTAQADHYGGMLTAWEHLRELGYRRPAFYVHPDVDAYTRSAWTAAYLLKQRELRAADRLPPYVGPSLDERDAWLARHRPDVVLHNSWHANLAPHHVIALDSIAPEQTGIDQHRDLIGHAAVNQIAAQLARNERGVPRCAERILITGEWVPGKTAPGLRPR